MSNDSKDDWDDKIDPILFGYRVKIQSTRFSPLELVYGVRARLPLQLADAGDVSAAVPDAAAVEDCATYMVAVCRSTYVYLCNGFHLH